MTGTTADTRQSKMPRKKNKRAPTGPRPGILGKSFSSEDLLRQAIAGLLGRMPGISAIQILHGQNELGKDIVFTIRGAFGELIPCACVVKNTRISGDVSRPDGARNVLFQAEQALDSPYIDGTGNQVWIERVYIVTPVDISLTTIQSVQGRLKDRSRQVVFVSGAALFDLFKLYWPEFMADEAAIVERHLQELISNAEDEAALRGVTRIYDLGHVDTSLRKVYVSQGFYRELSSWHEQSLLKGPLLSMLDLEQERWERKDRNAALAELDSLGEALSFLRQWGYVDAQDEMDMTVLLEWLSSTVREGGQERRDRSSDKSDPEPWAGKPYTNEQLLLEAESARDRALSRLRTSLSTLCSFAERNEEENLSILSAPSFISSCALDDCARIAPPYIFKRTRVRRIEFPKDLLEKWSGSLLVVGSPGHGKTSFCRWRALQDAERFSARESRVIPLYVPLHSVARKEIGTFEETFLGALGKSGLLSADDRLSTGNRPEKVRLYLDGLDEVTSPELRRKLVELVRLALEGSDRYQVIITARDYVHEPWLCWLPKVHLRGFDDSEIAEFIEKWLGTGNEALRFTQQITRLTTLSPLMRVPLLATLAVIIFRATGNLPDNKIKLYDTSIKLLSGGWDVAKGVLRSSNYGLLIKESVLTALAGIVHARGRRKFGAEEVDLAVQATFPIPPPEGTSLLLHELLEDGVIKKEGSSIHFSHFSFQEFLAARDLMRSPGSAGAAIVLRKILSGEDWWRGVIRFYFALWGKPHEIIHWVLVEAGQVHPASIPFRDQVFEDFLECFPDFPISRFAGPGSRFRPPGP